MPWDEHSESHRFEKCSPVVNLSEALNVEAQSIEIEVASVVVWLPTVQAELLTIEAQGLDVSGSALVKITGIGYLVH